MRKKRKGEKSSFKRKFECLKRRDIEGEGERRMKMIILLNVADIDV